jgi:hypothetical protein
VGDGWDHLRRRQAMFFFGGVGQIGQACNPCSFANLRTVQKFRRVVVRQTNHVAAGCMHATIASWSRSDEDVFCTTSSILPLVHR